jgi:hypothetical protein
MAKRGRKPKSQKDEYIDVDENGGRGENFTDMDEELLYHLDSAEIERYIRPYRKYESEETDEDSFSYWYGQN